VQTPTGAIAAGVLAIYLVLAEFMFFLLHQNPYGLGYGFLTGLKLCVLYGCSIMVLDPRDRELILRYAKTGLLLIAIALILSLLFDLGRSTYSSGGYGTKSFFASGNGIGVYLGAGTFILVVLDIYGRQRLKGVEFVILSLGLTALATKAAFVFLAMSIVTRLLYHRHELLFSMIAFVTVIVIFSAEMVSLASQIFEIPMRRFLASDGNLVWFLTSARNTFIEDALAMQLQDHSTGRIIFGSGAFLGFQDPSAVRKVDLLEADLFDIYFIYGLCGLALYFAFFVRLMGQFGGSRFLQLLTIAIFLHSAFLGHVMLNGLIAQLVLVMNAVSAESGRAKHSLLFHRV
jgi:hypothetical protein